MPSGTSLELMVVVLRRCRLVCRRHGMGGGPRRRRVGDAMTAFPNRAPIEQEAFALLGMLSPAVTHRLSLLRKPIRSIARRRHSAGARQEDRRRDVSFNTRAYSDAWLLANLSTFFTSAIVR